MYNVAIYARISSEKQNKELSIPAQLHECRSYAIQQGWTVVKEYQEIKSGRSDQRPQFQQMVIDAENEMFEIILVHEYSRFARSNETHVLYEAKFAEYGVTLVSKSEPIEKTPSGNLMKTVLTGFNSYFSEQLSLHVRKAQRQLLREGLWPGPPPIGYKKISKRDCGIDAVHGPKIAHAFEAFATGKYGLKEWAKRAWELGHRTRTNKKIGVGGWSETFHNKFYIGVMVWGGQEYPGRHEKLVDIATFEKVQSILANRTSHKRQRHFYPLAGLLFSAESNSRMIGHSATAGNGEAVRYYKSMDKSANGREHYADADKLEYFFEMFLRDVRPKDVLPRNIDPEIELGLRVAASVGHLYPHLKDYQKIYLSKLVVNGRGVNVRANKVVSIKLNDAFLLCSSKNKYPG